MPSAATVVFFECGYMTNDIQVVNRNQSEYDAFVLSVYSDFEQIVKDDDYD